MYSPATHDVLTDEALVQRLEAGELLVLPAARATRAYRQLFDAHQQARGKRAWPAPRIFSWKSWTASLWSELIVSGADSRLLLNPAQEHSLWAEMIAEMAPEGTLEQKHSSLASLAQSGFSLAAAWECLARLHSTALTHDHRTFALWAEVFQKRCEQGGYVSPALVERALREHLEDTGVPQPAVPATLLLLNWPEFTPAQVNLLRTLEKRGTKVEVIATTSRATSFSSAPSAAAKRPPDRVLAIAPNEREELFCAAKWIRGQLQRAAGDRTCLTALRIGVLLPNSPVPELEAVFREVLAPELQAVTTDVSAAPWEFSRNERLAAVPLIAAALDLARFCVQPLALHAVSTLLLSPYLGEEINRESNARFDAQELRRGVRLRPEISLAGLASLASTVAPHGSGSPPAPWLHTFSEFAAKSLDAKLRRSYSEWMEVLRRLLRIAGWPGSRTLSAREHAAHRAWESTLDLVATLDFSGRRIPFVAALAAVERQSRETTLDLSSTGAPVAALPANEATGCAFDLLVLLRGSEEHWPPSRPPHSLLSIGLQRELGMPGTDTRRERRLIESLLRTSARALATCAEANAEGALRPATMFRDLGFEELTSVRLVPSLPKPLTVREEPIADDTPLPSLPSKQVRGGARVLQLQAACGFRAFAEVRLAATEVESRQAGFDPRETGNLLHGAMERFWKQVGSQATLRSMSFEQRDELLVKCIDGAVSTRISPESAWDRAYLDLQKYRMRRLLRRWLDSELQRAPFTVAALEHKTSIEMGPLELSVRIDRLDQLDSLNQLDRQNGPDDSDGPDGFHTAETSDPARAAGAGWVLVDYKSGYAADPKAWFGERPDQPQLPLYALLHPPEEVKAVAFAHIHSGKLKYAGLESEPGVLGEYRSGTLRGEHMEQWRTTLQALAEEFSQGVSEARPKDAPQTCKYCAQRLLCRFQPLAPGSREELEDEAVTGTVYG